MDPDPSLSVNESVIDAAIVDSKWKAYIPIQSTHFVALDNGSIVPNCNHDQSTVNLLDFFNSDHLNNRDFQNHKESLNYPLSSQGFRPLVQLEGYHVVDD